MSKMLFKLNGFRERSLTWCTCNWNTRNTWTHINWHLNSYDDGANKKNLFSWILKHKQAASDSCATWSKNHLLWIRHEWTTPMCLGVKWTQEHRSTTAAHVLRNVHKYFRREFSWHSRYLKMNFKKQVTNPCTTCYMQLKADY